MWKKARVLIIAITALGFLTVFFSWQINFLNLPVRMAIEDLTGQSVTFQSINYHFFNRLTVEHLTLGKHFRCESLTVYVTPWKLLANPDKPQCALSHIHISRPWISADADFMELLGKMKLKGSGGPAGNIRISWDNAEISNRFLPISQLNGQIKLAEKVSGKMSGKTRNHQLNISLLQEISGHSTRGEIIGKIAGPVTNAELRIAWDRSPDETITASLDAPKIQWREFNLANSTGTLSYGKDGFAATIVNAGGNIQAAGRDADHFRVQGNMLAGSVLPAATGQFKLLIEKDSDTMRGFINGSGIAFKQVYFGNLNISFSRMGDGTWSYGGLLDTARYSFNGVLKSSRELELYMRAGRKGFGKVSGSIDPLKLDVKLMNWPAENIPVPGGMYSGIKGILAVRGTITADSAVFDLTANGMQVMGGKQQSLNAHLAMQSGRWFCQAASETNDWRISGRYLSGNEWDAKAEFKELMLTDYLPWIRCRWPIYGRISGTANYSSQGMGDAQFLVNGVTWDNQPVGNGKLNMRLTPEELEIKEIALRSGKGTMTGHALIGLSPNNNFCDVGISFYHFQFTTVMLHGPLAVKGKLDDVYGHRAFVGVLQSGNFGINSWMTRRLYADISLSNRSLKIRNLVWSPLIQGGFRIDFLSRALTGKLAVNNLPLENLSTGIRGNLKGTAFLAGTIDAPEVNLEYAVANMRYNAISFSHSGVAVYRNKSLFFDKVRLSMGTGIVNLSGKAWPDVKLAGNIDSCPAQMFSALSGVAVPLSGSFSGPIKIEGALRSPAISLDIIGKGVSCAGTGLSECKAKFRYHQGTVSVDSLSAKRNDSELHLLAGTRINITRQHFDVVSESRNVHLGPVDCFGNLKVSGDWKLLDNKVSLSGLLNADNFWINQHNVEELAIGLSYKDGVVTFSPPHDTALRMTGSVDFRQWPQVKFDRWNLASRDKGEFGVDGEIGDREWQFSLSGKSVDAETVSEMLGLPMGLAGNLDITMIGRGSLEHPSIEGSISIANGTVSEVPFDSINVQFNVRQDVLTLMRARLMRKDQYSISATGFCPLFLTEGGKKHMLSRPIDLTVNIEEGTLNLLTALTSDIKSASGSLRAQGRITGTFERPVSNGYLKVINGEINSKRYFSKWAGMNVDFLWKDNLLSIRELNGRVGDGRVAGSGTIQFDGFHAKEYALQFESVGNRGVPLSIPELPIPSPLFKSQEWEFFSNLSHGNPRFALKFSGTGEKPVLSGWIEIENTHFTYPSLAKGGGGESILDPLFAKLLLDLDIRSGKNTWYDNELCSVNVTGGIHLKGKWFSPSASGRMESVRGTVSYLGIEFKIKQAALEIVKETAYLEGEAESEIYGKTAAENDVIQLYIDKARIEHIKPRFVSKNNPDMTPEKALLRATGIDPEIYSQADQEYMLRQQMIRLVDSTLTTPLARNLLRKSGIVDSFRVQYLSQEPIKPLNPANPTLTELFYGTKYSLEKYLTDRMFLGYSVTFDQIQNRLDLRHEMELSYRWQKNIFLKGTYELQTDNPIRQPDRRITLEQQWRFGLPKKNK